MVICHYIERIGELLLPYIFLITYAIIKKYYSVEPISIHTRSLINIIQENNWVVTTKKGMFKLPIFIGNGEQRIPIYGCKKTRYIDMRHCFITDRIEKKEVSIK